MPATFNLADLFELVADTDPTREVLVTDRRRLSYAGLDQRATRLAHALADRRVGPGDHIGLQLLNGSEYLEAMLAAYKLRAVPVNVNYRYVEAELRYLYDDADLVAVLYHREFAQRVAKVAPGVATLRTFVVIDDDSGATATVPGEVAYEEALDAASPERDFGPRSSDDIYIAYTGGTTGMPKGVVWRHEDIFFAAMGGGDPLQMGDFISAPEELPGRMPETGMTALGTPPLMHVSAQWLAWSLLYTGGKVVLTPFGRFDPPTIWRTVGEEQVNTLVIVGDAMAAPLADELEAHPDDYDLSSLIVIGSGGAILSPTRRRRIEELLPDVMIVDGFGSSETGPVGSRTDADRSAFTLNDQTAVLDDHHRPVEPGSGVVGHLARRGHIPLGYHGDPDKTAETFVEVDGERWVLPGDMATIDDDGAILLLGRGSVSINTGGEKVFPEEVESVLKAHPAIDDCLVVGVSDERWGERVTAVVRTKGATGPTLDDVQAHCREHLAGYKVPRDLVLVEEFVRFPTGKPDYRWAQEIASRR